MIITTDFFFILIILFSKTIQTHEYKMKLIFFPYSLIEVVLLDAFFLKIFFNVKKCILNFLKCIIFLYFFIFFYFLY